MIYIYIYIYPSRRSSSRSVELDNEVGEHNIYSLHLVRQENSKFKGQAYIGHTDHTGYKIGNRDNSNNQQKYYSKEIFT